MYVKGPPNAIEFFSLSYNIDFVNIIKQLIKLQKKDRINKSVATVSLPI